MLSIKVYNIIDYRRRRQCLDRSIEAYKLFGKTPDQLEGAFL